MKRNRLVAVLASFALAYLILCPSTMTAQGLFGTISGVVSDPSGAVVIGATVTVTHIDTNVAKTLTTNSAGVYSATLLSG